MAGLMTVGITQWTMHGFLLAKQGGIMAGLMTVGITHWTMHGFLLAKKGGIMAGLMTSRITHWTMHGFLTSCSESINQQPSPCCHDDKHSEHNICTIEDNWSKFHAHAFGFRDTCPWRSSTGPRELRHVLLEVETHAP
eukprot:1158050-Pelagomonas_calceolata.AAC.9